MSQSPGTRSAEPGAAAVEGHGCTCGGVVEIACEEFDRAVFATIDGYLATHPGGQERLIPVLHHAQEEIGYLPVEVQEYVARALGMSPIQVYGVISFYHFFTTVPRGRYQMKVCMGTACFVRGGLQLLETLEGLLGLKIGGVTDDRLFSLEQVRCIGACGLAPALMVNDDVHGNLTPTNVRKLVRRLRSAARREAAEVAGEVVGQEAANGE